MNDQEQIKALAELDGYEFNETDSQGFYTLTIGNGAWERCSASALEVCLQYCPNYLTSRDAIIPVIEKQPSNIQNLIANFLTNQKCWTYLCTPKQLAEALLRSTGKWKD